MLSALLLVALDFTADVNQASRVYAAAKEQSKKCLTRADLAAAQKCFLDAVPETSVVIPARALNELARVLADIDDPVEVVLAAARNQVLFHLEGVDLVSRLIDGQFPNYQQVLPQSHNTRAVLDREELLRAVRPAALIAH